MDNSDAKARIKGYIDSRLWWVMFPFDRFDALAHIEETYYAGEASADFRLVTGFPIPGFAVAFALKERMSAEQIADLVTGMDPATLADHDLLIFAHPEDGTMKYQAQIVAFADWLQN